MRLSLRSHKNDFKVFVLETPLKKPNLSNKLDDCESHGLAPPPSFYEKDKYIRM